MFPRVSIIILNWNGWKDTIECLESLYRITYPNYDVIVVDNGSKDNSVQKIKEYAEGKIKVNSKFFKYNPNNKPIRVFEISEEKAKQGKFNRSLYEKYDADRRMILIRNKHNYGFTGGNNIGIKFALSVLDSDYVLLLNNDTVVRHDLLNKLIDCAYDSNKKLVSPIILDYNTNDIQYMGGYFDFIWGVPKRSISVSKTFSSESCITTELLSGACLLINSKTILFSLKLLPDIYFAYWEDVEYSLRSHRLGYKNLVSINSVIWHKESTSIGKFSRSRLKLSTRNRFLFYLRNYNNKLLILPAVFYFFLSVLYILSFQRQDPRDIARGVIEGFHEISPRTIFNNKDKIKV